VEIRVKTPPWSVWSNTLTRDLMEFMELTPNKLKALCEVDWPAFGVGRPLEGSLDKPAVNEVYRVIVGKPGHPEQSPYIDCWQDAVLSQPTWLRPCLEETCSIMVAGVAVTSKRREKTKEPVLAEEISPPYVPLYPPLPPAPSSAPSPSTSHGEAQGVSIPVKSVPGAVGALTPHTSPGLTDSKSTPSLPILTPHLPVPSGVPNQTQ
jgi:hypothetical protein